MRNERKTVPCVCTGYILVGSDSMNVWKHDLAPWPERVVSSRAFPGQAVVVRSFTFCENGVFVEPDSSFLYRCI
jgi:hypothetical protein